MSLPGKLADCSDKNPETNDMCTTFRCIDIIYKAIAVLCVGIIVLHGNLNHDTIFFTFTVNDLWIQCFFTSVEISNKFPDTTFIVEDFFFFLVCLKTVNRI